MFVISGPAVSKLFKKESNAMRRSIVILTLFSILLQSSCSSFKPVKAPNALDQIVWEIDNITSIGGHETAVLGTPVVIETNRGRAVEFHGEKDGLIVDSVPLAGAESFTLEIVFRPDAGGLKEQRFLHLQQNDANDRILIETRLTGEKWYLDTYIESSMGKLPLYEPKNTHPAGRWYSAALVYDRGQMRHYVNGVLEMSGKLAFSPLGKGKTSIGVRMNRVFWFKGAIRKVRFTPRVLEPDELLMP
jgi:hypothetical protein